MSKVLTCDHKGPGKVAMVRAALSNQEVLNLKGSHSEAGAEVAASHGEVGAAAGCPDDYQRLLTLHIHHGAGVCQLVPRNWGGKRSVITGAVWGAILQCRAHAENQAP